MKLSLRMTLALYLAGLQAIAFSIVITLTYLSSERAMLDHARSLLSDVATNTIEHSRGFLKPAEGAAELATRLAEHEIVASDDRVLLEKLLYQQLKTAPQFAGIFYGDEAGNFVYVMHAGEGSPGPFRSKIITRSEGARATQLIWRDDDFIATERRDDPADTYDPRSRPWYELARGASGSIWTDPYIFFSSQEPGITVSSPVTGADGTLRGVIGVDIEIGAISDFLGRLRIGENGRALVLNHNGDVVAHPDRSIIKSARPDGGGGLRFAGIEEIDDPVARAAFAALASQGTPSLTGEMSSSFDYGGAKYVSTLVPMEGVPRWTIGVYALEDDFIGAIKANRNQHIVIAIAVALATAVIGWLLAHVIHRPVAVLAARANHISRGRIDPPSPLPSSFAELDRAGRAFNRMSTSLTRYKEENDDLTAKLRHASRTLEIKVDERTAELAAVNDKLHDEIAVRALAEKQAEDEVARHRATTEKLEAAVQNATVANAAKSRFLSSMSHELRSPLNAIIGFSQMAIDRDATLEREARLSYLSHIRSSGDQLLALVNDVLDLESIESGHTLLSIQAVDPRTCIDAVIAEQAVPAADKRITLLDRTDEGGLPTLSTDTVRMRQILCNLLSNAVKYTDEGGEIRIDAARRGAFLRLTVSDNGPGIDKALHHRVFEPFDRLGAESSSIEGTGVGLALSRQLAESLGGRIGFDSELGRGSDFWVELPMRLVRGGAQGRGARTPGEASSAFSDSKRILYVDDNALNVMLIAELLSVRKDIALSTASTGTTGLGLAAAETFDLMLIDINLPDMTGFELLKRLRKLQPHAIALALSADAMPDQIEQGIKAGFDGYVTKPIDISGLERELSARLANVS